MDDNIFKYGFIIMLIFFLTSIFWNIPAVMKSTYTYKDLQEQQIIEERQENVIIIKEKV